VCELHIPGPAVAAGALLAALIEAGARTAQAGEFTARAFFSGRIDLSAAEGVADIIDATDQAQVRSAVAAMGGQVHRLCSAAAARIADALAAIEASIDLADEQIELDSTSVLASNLTDVARDLDDVARRASDMPDNADRPRIVIAGRPNVGKSSLLNALTGSDRAIVSAMAGTTRGVLSSATTLEGAAVVIQDAAGFVAPDQLGAADSLETAGQHAARSAVAAADVILFVLDASRDDLENDRSLLREVRMANPSSSLVFVLNKSDLVVQASCLQRTAEIFMRLSSDEAAATQTTQVGCLHYKENAPVRVHYNLHDILAVSAATGEGLNALRAAMARKLALSTARPGEALGLHLRQKRCLLEAARDARQAATLLAAARQVADVAELASIDLRQALAQLGQISGQVVTEDILGRIFGRFCVGK